MIFLFLLLPILSFAQPLLSPLIDMDKLEDESLKRTVFIKFYPGGDKNDKNYATGTVLKDGIILTNAHVVRPFLQDKKTLYTISGYHKSVVYITKVEILACDDKNDICLLKTDATNLKYFSVKQPSYRTITPSNPVGLYEKELVFFNGASSGSIELKKARHVAYRSSPYDRSGVERRVGIDGIELSSENGGTITSGGDSGGPVFDSSLTLFGIVRDQIIEKSGKRSMALPANQIRDFFEKNKNNVSIGSLNIEIPK